MDEKSIHSEPVPLGDATYPVYAVDSYGPNRLLLSSSMLFNDVLDVQVVKSSLERLIQIGDWRKLGGRLQEKHKGTLEIRVPDQFTDTEPAFAFTHHTHDICFASHPQGKLYPRATSGPSTQRIDYAALSPLLSPPGLPKDFAVMIKQKWPQLTLFISSFQDATFMSLIWPHTLMDASGFHSLLKNWSYVMAGEMDKVEPVLGASVDVLAQIDTEANEKATHVLDSLRMSALQKTIFALRFLWRKMTVRQELRMVYIPDAVMQRLNDRTAQEAKDAAEKGDQDAFISEGDVLVGWLMRVNAAAHNRPITLFSLVNARSRLPGTSKAEGVYIQNIIGMAFIMYSAEDLKQSGGSIALKHRRSLVPQLHGDQLAMYMQKLRKTAVEGGIPPVLYGDSSAVLAASNNITKSSPFSGADFGPAVLRAGDESKDRKNPPGTMTVYYNCIVGPGSALPGVFLTWGRDHSGGLWLTASLSLDQWTWLERDMTYLSAA